MMMSWMTAAMQRPGLFSLFITLLFYQINEMDSAACFMMASQKFQGPQNNKVGRFHVYHRHFNLQSTYAGTMMIAIQPNTRKCLELRASVTTILKDNRREKIVTFFLKKDQTPSGLPASASPSRWKWWIPLSAFPSILNVILDRLLLLSHPGVRYGVRLTTRLSVTGGAILLLLQCQARLTAPLWPLQKEILDHDGIFRKRFRLFVPINDPDQHAKNKATEKTFWVRQVPGDGSCLFHAVAACLDHAETNPMILQHNPPSPLKQWSILKIRSAALRAAAVDRLENIIGTLETNRNNNKCNNKPVKLCNGSVVSTLEWIESVAASYGISAVQYCVQMRHARTWGGGPEMVALSDVLQRPIYLYSSVILDGGDNDNDATHPHNRTNDAELTTNQVEPNIGLRHDFTYDGDPHIQHDRKTASALHILCTDASFPNKKEDSSSRIKGSGTHFLALLP
eukprot:scaffold126641_cov59-Attheya_sp.AAC.1